MQTLKNSIENIFKERNKIATSGVNDEIRNIVNNAILLLDKGILRVAEKINNSWVTHEWLKKAILLYFIISKDKVMDGGSEIRFFDKIPLKCNNWNKNDFQYYCFRNVPMSSVRYGAYIARNVVLMPSYVNIGAYVGESSMIDTWSTVGSCAQIGKNVHLSGGVGIGGVLEPVVNNPTIIEDNCFIGARSEIAEGVIIEEGAVISMGVYIGQSTKIYDRESGDIYYGRVPKNSVVVPGTLPSKKGFCQLYCAVIVKKVDEKTKSKIGINNLLRISN